jgi:RecB family exonuclease
MIKHVSASSITLFKEGCQRKWYYRYIVGTPSETSEAMTLGSKVHEALEQYLLKGEKPTQTTLEGKIAAKGLHLLPPRNEEMRVEISLKELPIPDLPIPFKGFIDLLEMEGTPHVLDHKTTSNLKWAKTEQDLSKNIQLIIYARHVLEHSDSDDIRLTHIYYVTRHPHNTKEVSVVVSREHVYAEFEKILETVHEMLAAAQLPMDAVPKQKGHCYAYGKRCPHYNECYQTTASRPMSDKQANILNKLRGEETKKQGTVTLYVSCRPLKKEVTPLSEAINPLIDEVCEQNNVKHPALIPYGQGWPTLSVLIKERGLPSGTYWTSSSGVYDRICDVLIEVCDEVIIGH